MRDNVQENHLCEVAAETNPFIWRKEGFRHALREW